MRKPKALRSRSVFLGNYWLELQMNGDLVIMPRVHHPSNAKSVSAGVDIVRYQPIELRIGFHKGKK